MQPLVTPDEYAWLEERIPEWHRRKEQKYKGFVGNTAAEFLRVFPNSKIDRSEVKDVSVAFVFTPQLSSY